MGRQIIGDPRFSWLVVLTAVLSLPAILPGKTGWLTMLIPLTVFHCLILQGEKGGTALIRTAILLSAGVALLLNALQLLVFSLMFVPLGFVFFRDARLHKNEIQAGMDGVLWLLTIWLLFWTFFGLLYQTNPYSTLLTALDQGLTGAYSLYQETAELPAETIQEIEAVFSSLRHIIPKVMPSLMVTGILYTVWINLALGNWLVKNTTKVQAPWRDFRNWRLPDNLVWGGITGGAAFLLLPEPLSVAGLNALIVFIGLYFIQGLAVLFSLLMRWSVPRPLRVLIYALIIIQSVGFLLISILGVADVWADIRKLGSADEKTDAGSGDT